MAEYEVMVTRTGYTYIEANSMEEAQTIAEEMVPGDFEWSESTISTITKLN